jgi:hypothetical protein
MNDFGQAADSAKAMAEGQDIRPQSSKANDLRLDVCGVCVRSVVRVPVAFHADDVGRFDGDRVLMSEPR